MHWPLPLPLRPRSPPLSPGPESNPFSSDRPKKLKRSKSSECLYTWSPITTTTLLCGLIGHLASGKNTIYTCKLGYVHIKHTEIRTFLVVAGPSATSVWTPAASAFPFSSLLPALWSCPFFSNTFLLANCLPWVLCKQENNSTESETWVY